MSSSHSVSASAATFSCVAGPRTPPRIHYRLRTCPLPVFLASCQLCAGCRPFHSRAGRSRLGGEFGSGVRRVKSGTSHWDRRSRLPARVQPVIYAIVKLFDNSDGKFRKRQGVHGYIMCALGLLRGQLVERVCGCHALLDFWLSAFSCTRQRYCSPPVAVSRRNPRSLYCRHPPRRRRCGRSWPRSSIPLRTWCGSRWGRS